MRTLRGRRAAPGQIPVALFPFLSVLACTIGALVLAIAILSIVSSKREPTPEEQTYVKIVDAIRGVKVKQSETQRLIGQERALRERLQELAVELSKLKANKAAAHGAEQQIMRILQDVADTRARVTKLERVRAELEIELDKKRQLAKELPPIGTVKIVAGATHVGPDGTRGNRPKRPVFLECVGENIIIHPAGIRVPTGRINTSVDLDRLIDRVKRGREDGVILILLIRPDGVKTFDRLHRLVRAKEVRYGYTVAPGYGPVDLSDFKAVSN